MDIEELKKIVLKEIHNIPKNFRCHEMARKIGNQLKQIGFNVAIIDGIAEYDTSSLITNFISSEVLFKGFSEEEINEFLKESKSRRKKKLRVFHSWCEVNNDSGDIIMVDWHAYIKPSQDEAIENLLIINEKSNLPHSYLPIGMTLGKWIILKKFPPYATRLRI